MRLYGLTGPIAAGKSAVARLLAEHGARIIDADRIGRDVLKPGEPAWQAVRDWLGPHHPIFIPPEGAIDRAALGRIVFGDADARRRLESLTHPAIGAAIGKQLAAARNDPQVRVAIIEAILIMRSPLRPMLDGIVVVTAPAPTRLARAKARDGLQTDELQQRIDAQAELETEFAQADFIVRNDGDLERLRARVDALWPQLLAGPSPAAGA